MSCYILDCLISFTCKGIFFSLLLLPLCLPVCFSAIPAPKHAYTHILQDTHAHTYIYPPNLLANRYTYEYMMHSRKNINKFPYTYTHTRTKDVCQETKHLICYSLLVEAFLGEQAKFKLGEGYNRWRSAI